jgi:chromatin remodeling complex protein RSC6
MNTRGWVYLITNKAMPGLVKVGYSTKDPQFRAQELGSTGVPHPFVVEADFICINPREVEQMVHMQLVEYREGKEWFRCSLNTATNAVLRHINSTDKNSLNFTENNLSKNIKSSSNLNDTPNDHDTLISIYIPSSELGAIIGYGPTTRNEATKQIWAYIKKHNLQDAANRRMINADAKLKEIFKKPQASMFEMTKMINEHLKQSQFNLNDISVHQAALASIYIPSSDLGAIIGSGPITRDGAAEKIWAYIEKHNLQHQQYRRMINTDAKLKKLSGKDYLSMFEMTKIINEHLKR